MNSRHSARSWGKPLTVQAVRSEGLRVDSRRLPTTDHQARDSGSDNQFSNLQKWDSVYPRAQYKRQGLGSRRMLLHRLWGPQMMAAVSVGIDVGKRKLTVGPDTSLTPVKCGLFSVL